MTITSGGENSSEDGTKVRKIRKISVKYFYFSYNNWIF